MNTQDPSKVSCSGDAGTDEPVRIVVSKDDGSNVSLDTGIPADVNLGDVVTATAANAGQSDFDSDSRVQIFDGNGNLLQTVEFHTSCSQDLALGDKFGAVEIVGFTNNDQGIVSMGAEVQYVYEIGNEGTTDIADITVVDDLLGTVPDTPIAELLAGATAIRSLTAFIDEPIGDVVENTVTVMGTGGGATCQATDSLTVEVREKADACAVDDPTALEFEYVGDVDCSATTNTQEGKVECSGTPGPGAVNIVVIKDADKITAVPSTVSAGETFSYQRNDDTSNLGGDIEFDVGGQSLKIHTSCSKPLNTGDQFGAVKLIGFTPKQ
jgi:hypothetical protein